MAGPAATVAKNGTSAGGVARRSWWGDAWQVSVIGRRWAEDVGEAGGVEDGVGPLCERLFGGGLEAGLRPGGQHAEAAGELAWGVPGGWGVPRVRSFICSSPASTPLRVPECGAA